MRLLVILLASAVMTWPAFAKSKAVKKAKPQPKFSGKLLTFSQLSRLPKAKRMEYIKGVTKLLVIMEAFNNKYLTAQNSNTLPSGEQFASLIHLFRLIPESNAQGVPAANVDVRPVYDEALGIWSCPKNFSFDNLFFACLLNNEYGYQFFTKSCPKGYLQYPHFIPKTFACMPPSNFKDLPGARRDALPKLAENFNSPGSSNLLSSTAFLNMSRTEQEAQLFKPAARPSNPPRAANAGTAAQPPAPAAAAATNGTTAVKDSGARARFQFPESNAPKEVGSNHGTPLVTQEPLSYGGRATSAGSEPQEAQAATPSPQSQSCTPPALTCRQQLHSDPEEHERRLKLIQDRFRSAEKYDGKDANICISGGYVSKYKNPIPIKKPSTCTIESEIKYEKDGQQKVLEGSQCGSPDKAACNTALFCLGVKFPGASKVVPAPFCVDRVDPNNSKNPQITARCAEEYAGYLKKDPNNPIIATNQKVEEQGLAPETIAALNASVAPCDPTSSDLGIPAGAHREAWDYMVQKTQELRDVWCGWGDFAALFCAECEVITSEIYLLNKNATGSGCPDQTVASAAGAGTTETAPPARAVREPNSTKKK